MKANWFILFLILTMGSYTAVGQNSSNVSDFTPFYENGLYGYKNHAGEVVIQPKYVDAYPFSDGLGRVALKKNKYFYINSSDKKVVSAEKYHDAGDFHNGLAWVGFLFEDRSIMQYGYINKKGKRVIKISFTSPGDFIGEVALAYKKDLYFINKAGKIVSEALYDRTSYHDRIVRLKKKNGDNRYYYFDVNGNNITPTGFEKGYVFSEGMAAVSNDGKWGFINTKGDIVIPLKYESVEASFNEGLAMVDDENRRLFIDKSGNQVGSDYYPIGNTKGIDLAVEVFNSNGKHGLRFRDKEYLKAEYDQISLSVFSNNRIELICSQNNKQGLCGLYIQEGLIYFKHQKPAFDQIYTPFDSKGIIRIVQNNDKIGLMRIINGDNYSLSNPDYWVSPPKYNFVDLLPDYIIIAENGRVGMIDHFGKLKVKPEYDEVSVYKEYPTVFTGITNGIPKYINDFGRLVDDPDQYIAQQIEQDYKLKIEDYMAAENYRDAVITAQKLGDDEIMADILIKINSRVQIEKSLNSVISYLTQSGDAVFNRVFDIADRINDDRKEELVKMRSDYLLQKKKMDDFFRREKDRQWKQEFAEREYRRLNYYYNDNIGTTNSSRGSIGTYNSSGLKSSSSLQHQREMRNYREQTNKIKRETDALRKLGNYNRR